MPKLSKEQLLAARQRAAQQSLLNNAAEDPAFAEVDLSQYVNTVPANLFPVDPQDCNPSVPGPRAPTAPAPAPPGPKTKFSWPSNPKAFNFSTPLALLATYAPSRKPHPWQQEELYRIGGDINLEDLPREEWQDPTQKYPYIYNLVAANGSGKDTYFIAPVAIWAAMRYIRCKIVITSESHTQLKEQTFRSAINSLAEAINAAHGEDIFEMRELNLRCTYTGSEIIGFVSDEPGKVEGRHPFPESADNKMFIIINEAKSIKDTLYEAFSRFTGYSHWLQVSSPGQRSGQFYKSVEISDFNALTLGKNFTRRVTAFDCPNISRAHIEQTRLKHGENSYPYRTGIMAEFWESSEDVVIPGELLLYEPPHKSTYNLQPRGGLDIGLGGDPSEFWVVHGNSCLYHAETSTTSPNTLHDWIISQLVLAKARFGLLPADVSGDAGGIGAPILKRVCEAGYELRLVNNQSPAYDTNSYANIGAEMYFRVKRLVELGVIVAPKNFPVYGKWLKQLTTRKYFNNDKQRIQLEAKHKAKGRLGFSPDCADAYVLAYSGYPVEAFLSKDLGEEISREAKVARFVQEYEEKAFQAVEPFDPFARHKSMGVSNGLFNVIYK
jgi:hypothetical protein